MEVTCDDVRVKGFAIFMREIYQGRIELIKTNRVV